MLEVLLSRAGRTMGAGMVERGPLTVECVLLGMGWEMGVGVGAERRGWLVEKERRRMEDAAGRLVAERRG